MRPKKKIAEPIAGSATLFVNSIVVSQHAIDRFIQRRGHKKIDRDYIDRKIKRLLLCSYHLHGNHWYGGGLVYCIKNNVVVTIMDPTEKWILDRIYKYNIHNKASQLQ